MHINKYTSNTSCANKKILPQHVMRRTFEQKHIAKQGTFKICGENGLRKGKNRFITSLDYRPSSIQNMKNALGPPPPKRKKKYTGCCPLRTTLMHMDTHVCIQYTRTLTYLDHIDRHICIEISVQYRPPPSISDNGQ